MAILEQEGAGVLPLKSRRGKHSLGKFHVVQISQYQIPIVLKRGTYRGKGYTVSLIHAEFLYSITMNVSRFDALCNFPRWVRFPHFTEKIWVQEPKLGRNHLFGGIFLISDSIYIGFDCFFGNASPVNCTYFRIEFWIPGSQQAHIKNMVEFSELVAHHFDSFLIPFHVKFESLRYILALLLRRERNYSHWGRYEIFFFFITIRGIIILVLKSKLWITVF